jgi:hypothetical protein
MKRSEGFLIVTALVGLVANLLGIGDFFAQHWLPPAWQPDPGLLLAASFFLTAYTLIVWSVWTWSWSEGRSNRRQAPFLLNTLATLPLLTLWLSLLFSLVMFSSAPALDRWLLAMGFAWGLTPIIALGLTSAGEVLSTLRERGNRNSGG